MQVIKLEVVVIDFDGVGAAGVRAELENAHYSNRCISPQVKDMEVREIGDWSDDHPLNMADTADAELVRLFATENNGEGASGEAPTAGIAEDDGWATLEGYRAEMLDDQKRLAKLAADFLKLEAFEVAAQCAIKVAGLTQVIGRIPQRPDWPLRNNASGSQDSDELQSMIAECDRLHNALDAVLGSDVGVQTLLKLKDGQGTDTADGRAWLAAAALRRA